MRWSDVYISGSAVGLGDREDTAAAVADGRYDPDYQLAHGYLSVSVAPGDLLAEDMAVSAARRALSRSGVDPAGVRLVLYVSSTDPEGPDDLVPASYVQGQVVPGPASAVEVKQACNAALAALELAAAYLAAAPDGWSALVTTSDKYGLPGRYRFDPGNLPGDGATGLVLTRGRGVARLLSTAIVGDGRFNRTGAAPGDAGPDPADRRALLVEQRRRLQPMLRAMAARQRECLSLALADAGLDRGEISRWVVPNVGPFMVNEGFRKVFGIEESMTAWDWGRTTGHLGTGDQFAGLTHLLEAGAVRAGDRVALFSNGVGFSYGCAIVEITGEPGWPGEAEKRP